MLINTIAMHNKIYVLYTYRLQASQPTNRRTIGFLYSTYYYAARYWERLHCIIHVKLVSLQLAK